MMKKIIYIIGLFLLLVNVSCEEEQVNDEVILSRLFRPVNFEASISGNLVNFYWTGIEDAVYSLELSRDSMLFTTNLQEFSIEDSLQLTIDNLLSLTRYSARIKSVSKAGISNDSGWQEVTFVTEQENIFYAVSSEDINSGSVLLKWQGSKEVSHIEVSTGGIASSLIILSSEEISAGEKLVEGLSANTAYVFKIYLDDRLRGTISVRTTE